MSIPAALLQFVRRVPARCGRRRPEPTSPAARPHAPRGPAGLRRALMLAAACLVAGGTGRAQAQAPGMAFANWGTEQGLPSNIALDVAQTPDGYLWLASYEGILRFDGVAFRLFTEQDIPGLDRASFWRVDVDSAGALWGASERGGLVRYAGGEWTVFTTREGLQSDRVTALLPDSGGVLWVGTRGGVSRVKDGRIERLPAPAGMDELSVGELARAPDGTLWIGTTAEGVVRYRDGRYTRVGEPSAQVTSVYADADGTVWVGT
ncbi:MAG TPA: two-component regulator propeller domain-containing protein, partial [Longimicrobium sp.]|nr:two-component regulator propeller domain-containing protein [Longimicrobium sp.]